MQIEVDNMDRPAADPVMVDQLVHAIGVAMERATIKGVTSTADLLSAVFTVLDRMLRTASKMQDATDQVYNAKEINRVLTDMILEFGSTRH